LVTTVVIATALAALVLSLRSGAPSRLPAVALSSPALFHMQRVLVATFGTALLSVFLFRAAFGYFPQKVSTTSAEWPAVVPAAEVEERSVRADEQLKALVEQLGEEVELLCSQALMVKALAATLFTLHPEDARAILAGQLERLRVRETEG
jgi:hypothetical protein